MPLLLQSLFDVVLEPDVDAHGSDQRGPKEGEQGRRKAGGAEKELDRVVFNGMGMAFVAAKMHPRPILKRPSSATSSAEKHAVHFAALTSTFLVHSSAAYDRSPIVVAPNLCALPERGGRTYLLDHHFGQQLVLSPSKSPREFSLTNSFSSLALPDGGCLGGF